MCHNYDYYYEIIYLIFYFILYIYNYEILLYAEHCLPVIMPCHARGGAAGLPFDGVDKMGSSHHLK